jgi:Zn-finger nucleic acid-binding protein
MIEFDHHGVTLDRCLECDGLYFDSGELEAVLKAEYQEREEEPEDKDIAEPGDLGYEEDTQVDHPAASKSGFFRTLFSRRREEKQQKS